MDGRVPGHVRGREVRIFLDGRAVRAFEGETVGAALHAAGHRVLSRSIKYHRPRGLFCMTGACSGCMMRVNGVPNVRVCTLPCADGMEVRSQNALPSARLDVLSASDAIFRRSFDYHDKFIRPRFLTPVYHWFIRQMAGYGKIPPPSPLPPRVPPIRVVETDVVVAGGGSAGLGAALAASEAGARVLLLEESAALGGDLALVAPARGRALAADVAAAPRIDARVATPVVGVYPDEDGGRRVVAMGRDGLVEARARALVVAVGSGETPPLVPANDLPGILGARAALILLRRHGVFPGRRVVVHGDSPLGDALVDALAASGAPPRRIPASARIVKALGRSSLRGLVVEEAGRAVRVPCDALCVATGEAPRPELLQQSGARLRWDAARGGLVPALSRDLETSVPRVFAAGSAAGLKSPEEAFDEGRRAGRAAARSARAPEVPA